MAKKDNHVRFDLSPYLIHFYRGVNLNKSDLNLWMEDWGPGAMVESDELTAFFLLRNSIRLGKIWATWSMRGGRRTIYGPDPAVCFTDMPIAAFVEAGKAREAKGEAMSPIALLLPKNDVHAAGALPVIYGLSGSPSIPAGALGSPRIIPKAILPEAEQFRYVTLGTYGSVDWTHEREWRWPCRDVPPTPDDVTPPDGKDLPGLDLNFSGMGVIVSTKIQADKVVRDILVLNDKMSANKYSFVLVSDNIDSLKELREPHQVQEALAGASIDLSPFMQMSASRIQELVAAYEAAFAEIDGELAETSGREHGGCWLWLTNPAHEIARALMLSGRVKINNNDRYLVDLPFKQSLDLAEREELTRRVAKILNDRHSLGATYHSVLNSRNPSGVPFFSDPPFEDRFFYNYGIDDGGMIE